MGFGGGKKAIFKVTSCPLQLIFYFLTNRKMDLCEVEKDVSSFRLAFGQSVMPLGRGRENDFSKRLLTMKNHIMPSD
jgi:hypothetical protein